MAGVLTQDMVAIAPGRFGSPYAYGYGCGTFQRGTDLYIVCSNPGLGQSAWTNANIDGDPPPVLAQAHVLKSSDNGATWNEVDTDNGPEVSLRKSTISFRGMFSPMAACYQDADTLIVAYYTWDYVYDSPATIRFSTFSMASDAWGAEVPGGPACTTVDDQPQLNLSIARRAGDGALIVLFDGYERLAGINYCRLFYLVYLAGWGAAQDIDAAQTGSTDDYNIAGAVAGDADRTHLFYRTNIGGSNLLQDTLDAADTLVGAVTITTAVDTGTSSVPPFGAPWGSPASRSAAGVTTLFIPYVKDGTQFLAFSSAVSADSPTFAEVVINASQSDKAGIFNCGLLTASRGLAASTVENFVDNDVTGSQDVVTWEPETTLTFPVDPSQPVIENYSGLGITQGDGGYGAAGVVANGFFITPG